MPKINKLFFFLTTTNLELEEMPAELDTSVCMLEGVVFAYNSAALS